MRLIAKKNIFFIEEWEIDPLRNRLSNGPEQHIIEPKAMKILEYLARNAGEIVNRDNLFKELWPNQTVSEEALSRLVGQLRQCFNDIPTAPQYIATVHKKGYRLIANVSPKNHFKNITLNNQTFNLSNFYGSAYNIAIKGVIFLSTAMLIYSSFNQRTMPLLLSLKTKPITNDIGPEMQPALSPDGKNVVYLKTIETKEGSMNNHEGAVHSILYLKNIDSNRITSISQPKGSASHPAWSSDNRRIAYSHDSIVNNTKYQYAIYSTDITTGKYKQHIATSAHNHGLSWSPDGQYIVYPDGSNENEIRFLYRVNVNTNQRVRIAPQNSEENHTAYEFSYPKYSPDGRHIAVIRTDQSSKQVIELLNTKDYSSTIIYNAKAELSSIEWKDNNKLFAIDGHQEGKNIFELSITDGSIRYIPIEDKNIEYLSYSRASKRLTFETINQPYNIYSSNFTDSYKPLDYTRFTESNKKELEAIESADGKYTAIISSRNGAFEVWLRHTIDSHTEKLTSLHALSMADIDWSPDDKMVSFIAKAQNKENALHWIDINSQKINSFSFGENRYSLIGWESPDSLLFTSDHEGQWKLYRFYIDTKTSEQISEDPISYGRLSPDRKSIYFFKDKVRGIWKTDTSHINPMQVLGTENISINKGWTVNDQGILYFVYGEIGKYDDLYFFDFKKSKASLVSYVGSVYINRINWRNHRLYYTVRDERESDVAMVEIY